MDNSHGMIEGDAYTMTIRHIKLEEHMPKDRVIRGRPETANWNQRRIGCLNEGDQPAGQSKRYLNSASMSVLCRRIMAVEWMRALRRTIPENYSVTHKPDRGLLRAKDAR